MKLHYKIQVQQVILKHIEVVADSEDEARNAALDNFDEVEDGLQEEHFDVVSITVNR